MAEIFWHNLNPEEIAKLLGTGLKRGLTEKAAKTRQREFGKNLLPEEKPLSRLRIFLEQFRSPLIYILIIAGIVTLVLREFTDSIVIFGAVILNTIVGYFQENKACRALRELKKVVKIEAQVLRAGNPKIIDSSELVPGDIFKLNAGNKVPADGRIIESHNLKINEMALTGEWLAAEKNPEIVPPETPMADRDNMVYMGTIVEAGIGKAIVTETGLRSQIGKVAEMVKETKEEKTPLQKKLANLSKIIGGVISTICIFIFIEGVITGNSFLEMFTTSVAVAVAAIPEGLPVAMTVILALGMQRILKKKGLVRKLVSAETLGSTSIICTDKTATLTEGKIKVTKVLARKNKNLVPKIAILCNEAFIENPKAERAKWKLRGRPTDKALLFYGLEQGLRKEKLEIELPKIDEIPFDNQKKFLATLHNRALAKNNKNILFVSGAPEKILEISKMGDKERKKWKKELENLASQGFRTIALATKITEKTKIDEEVFQNLELAALLGLTDPLRKEVKGAIKICREAGMRPILVTGDHKLTAKAIAAEIGLKTKEENIIEGKDLDKLSDEEFERKVKNIEVYARAEPRHKLRIIETWQQKGEVVAMTGDGINDAPALKKANIGVALGSGTDVAKEASDLILLPDSFNIIVAAVEEGRAIIDNIRKVITYLLSDSFTEIILIATSLFLGFPLPIVAVQILWVNLIEDGPLGLCLAFEPKEKDLMKRKPQGQDVPLLTREMKVLIFIIGLVTDLLLLGLFFWLIKYSGYEIPHIRSVIFAGLTIDSIFYIFSCKSLRRNIWQINPFSNKFLVLAWIFGVVALIAALYLPALQTLLKTVPLNLFDWQLILSLGLFNIILIEATKHYFIVRHQTES
ncbi:MAG: HAD family hydrolase [Candidatus Nealsonbacteria bacterium]|nr:MAG: HAD family hydrolase [Candidatus Nealsonbacteria bacterium]